MTGYALTEFLRQSEKARDTWARLGELDKRRRPDESTQGYLRTLRHKVEAQQLLYHPTSPPAQMTTSGFEVFALGPKGEGFYGLVRWASEVDDLLDPTLASGRREAAEAEMDPPTGPVRELLSAVAILVAIDCVVRVRRAAGRYPDRFHLPGLHFGVNLDRAGVASGLALDALRIEAAAIDAAGKTLEFELNEDFQLRDGTPDTVALEHVKTIQSTYSLNLCLDDVNRLPLGARIPLEHRVTRVKIDSRFFQETFDSHAADYLPAVLAQLAAYGWGKPMVVEGVETPLHREALKRNWGGASVLHGQGWSISPSAEWQTMLERVPERRTDDQYLHPGGWQLKQEYAG